MSHVANGGGFCITVPADSLRLATISRQLARSALWDMLQLVHVANHRFRMAKLQPSSSDSLETQ